MRILILGEGPTDLGHTNADGTFELEGVLPILVRALISETAPDIPLEVRAGRTPRRFPKSTRQMGRSRYGYANQLWGLLALKEGREADAIVMVVDRDGKKHKDRIVELNKGREELRNENKPCAVGVAIEMIEAWLLADEKALRSTLGNAEIQRQPDPEKLTAGDEANERHPKGRLQRLIEHALGSTEIDFSSCYADIAMAADISTLERRCPAGFRPFADQVRDIPEF